MTDRELLELAARAAGIDIKWIEEVNAFARYDAYAFDTGAKWFRPLEDDGDALRLAVKLEIAIHYSEFIGEAEARFKRDSERLAEYGPDDPFAATRRAIVRAASEIGKTMDAPSVAGG